MGLKKNKKNKRVSRASSPKQTQLAHFNHLMPSWREVISIISFACSAFILFALLSYHRLDPSWSHITSTRLPANIEGFAGAWLADVLFYALGDVAYLVPFLLLYHLLKWLGYFSREERPSASSYVLTRWVGLVFILIALCALASLHLALSSCLPAGAGGLLGIMVGSGLSSFFSHFGATLILIAALLSGFVLFTHVSWLSLMEKLGRFISKHLSGVNVDSLKRVKLPLQSITAWFAHLRTLTQPAFRFNLPFKTQAVPKPSQTTPAFKTTPPFLTASRADESRAPSLLYAASGLEATTKGTVNPEPTLVGLFSPPVAQSTSAPVQAQSTSLIARNTKKVLSRGTQRDHRLPSLGLLDQPDQYAEKGYTVEERTMISREVEQCLKDFGVDVRVVAVHPGPVVTRFELELAAGTKASKITGLSKDLARSLSVVSVRVVEVIPGKSVVGFELPNKHREMVRLREVLETEQYQNARSPLTLALGKDIAGHPVIVDLAKMPHLLVAGTTGSGKSVGLNAMLLSLLCKSTPESLRMILIDPKMLELSVYEGIPHLLTPVVTDMKEAANALRWCVMEMERRYRLMASLGVRNITGYNNKIRQAKNKGTPLLDPLWRPNPFELFADDEGESGGEGVTAPPLEELPYIMVLIDEFADMMMVVGKKVEELIARIAQKARAAGIHLVLATQRPSVDVITGLIKANVPTRIAFQVSSKIDSRTILDQQGAEQLLGHGDMLYTAPGTGVPVRVHGAFVADEEVLRLVSALKEHSEPQYIGSILGEQEGGEGSGTASSGSGSLLLSGSGLEDDGEADPLYDQAVAIVAKTRRASISGVQRRLKIGFNRAARLIETMETAGVVSEVNTQGVREVLAAPPVED